MQNFLHNFLKNILRVGLGVSYTSIPLRDRTPAE